MGKVIDLTDDDDDRDVLTQTESDGLFGGVFLGDRPLASYLEPQEAPKYLLQNKKSGLRIVEESGTEELEPDGDYQALALATDLRLLVVVGGEHGDQSRSLALSEIVEADVESGLRSSTLTIETLSGSRWEFPCRGDPSVVADYLEDSAQAWANAGRLLDELEAAIDDAEDSLDAGDLRNAWDLIGDADETIRTATNRGAEVGPGARAQIAGRASSLRDRLRDLRREIRATAGARAHARAQADWGDDEYESAARAYESAIDSYERALDIDGSSPTDETLQARLRGATGERELLRVAPLVDADTSRRRASEFSDSEAAAEQWEQALDGYRELLGLEWGSEKRDFVVNRERIREQTVEIADDAIDDHLDAGIHWLQPGDELAVEGNDYEADELYKMARHQFEQAHRLASEVRPDRVEEIEAAIEAVETRLGGERPRERVPEDPITTEFDVEPAESDDERGDWEDSTVELSAEAATEEADDADAEEFEADTGEFDQLSFPSAAEQPAPSASDAGDGGFGGEEKSTSSGGPGDSPGGVGDDADSEESSLLDEIQSRKRNGGDGDSAPTGEPRTDGAQPVDASSESDEGSPSRDPADSTPSPEEPTQASDRTASSARDAVVAVDVPGEQLAQQLRTLDEAELTDLVAAIWEQEGWRTRVFDGGGDGTYDLVATRDDDGRRTFIWTLQRSDGGDVGEALLRRCATTLENSPSADGGVLVTTGQLTHAAESLAAGFEVEVVDCDGLVSRINATELPPAIATMLAE